MSDDPDLFAFPDLSDEAVIAVNDFLDQFYTHFQNHYFDQMHRYYADLRRSGSLHRSYATAAERSGRSERKNV